MAIMLGNLSLDEIQKRADVKFPEELIDFMKTRQQSEANNIKPGHWHCFDAPFTLVCGDRETANFIVKHLKPIGEYFKAALQISISKTP